MTSTTYTPAIGSIAARVIEHLGSHGGTLTPTQIAELFDTRRSGVSNALYPAVAAGVLVHHQGGRFKTGYHLPGTEPSFDAADDQAAEAKPAKARKARAPKGTAQASQRATRAPRATAPEPETEEAAGAIAALWDDGDVVLADVHINDDRETVTLTDVKARKLYRFFQRIYGPTVAAAAA